MPRVVSALSAFVNKANTWSVVSAATLSVLMPANCAVPIATSWLVSKAAI